MTRAEMHYLSCQDANCERFACVARRDYEQKLLVAEAKIKKLKAEKGELNKELNFRINIMRPRLSGLIVEEFIVDSDKPYAYSAGHGGSGGSGENGI